jgi:hypothetical protein
VLDALGGAVADAAAQTPGVAEAEDPEVAVAFVPQPATSAPRRNRTLVRPKDRAPVVLFIGTGSPGLLEAVFGLVARVTGLPALGYASGASALGNASRPSINSMSCLFEKLARRTVGETDATAAFRAPEEQPAPIVAPRCASLRPGLWTVAARDAGFPRASIPRCTRASPRRPYGRH